MAINLTNSPCTVLAASTAPGSPQTQGTTILITATSTCPSGALYQFWLLAPGSTTWQIVQPYSFSNQFTWFTSNASGTYRWSVWVRDNSSPGTTSSSLGREDQFVPSQAFTIT